MSRCDYCGKGFLKTHKGRSREKVCPSCWFKTRKNRRNGGKIQENK